MIKTLIVLVDVLPIRPIGEELSDSQTHYASD